jgi:hypothetical protein
MTAYGPSPLSARTLEWPLSGLTARATTKSPDQGGPVGAFEFWLGAAGEERLLFLTLEQPSTARDEEDFPGRWVSCVACTSEDWWLTALEMTLDQDESTLGIPLMLEWRTQGPLPESALTRRLGRLSERGVEVVEAALCGRWEERRFGVQLEGPKDARLAGIEASEQRLRRFLRAASATLAAG